MTEITPGIPNAHETTEGIDTSDVNRHTGWGSIPGTIRQLLSVPPLLPHESEEQFFELLESFRAYAEPENVIDYHLVFNATVLA